MRTRPFLALVPLVLSLTACSSSSEEPEASPTPAATSPTPTPGAPVAAVTWAKDIQPLVERTCVRCHTAHGQAPTDFTTYEQTAPYAALMAYNVSHGVMPPAAADPGCRDYKNSDQRFLSDEEIQTFQRWADAGAPQGDPETAPPPVVYHNALENPDLVLRIAQPYKPEFDSTGNMYTCFVIDPGRTEPFYLNAFQALIDHTEIVHHLVLYRDGNGDAMTSFGTDSFKCMNGDEEPGLGEVMSDWSMLAAWGPGGPPVELGEGRGMTIEPSQNLVLQIHYFASVPDADMIADQSGIVMRTSDQVTQEVIQAQIGPTNFVIPPGNPSFTVTRGLPITSSGQQILGVFPHMHVLGWAYHNWIERRNGSTECLVQSDAYAFHNQETYMFNAPVELNAGDKIMSECTWNNSTSNPNLIHNPPIPVSYGQGTDDEMCFFLTYVTTAP